MSKIKYFVILVLIISFTLYIFLLQKINKNKLLNPSKIIKDRNDNILRVYLNKNNQYLIPTNVSKVNQNFLNAIISIEDKNFYKHFGIDFLSVVRAVKQNLLERKIVSGASTITMQLARLLFPAKRTFKNKFIESFRALKLEYQFTKKDILNLYINKLPFGSNIIGIETASRKYFNKSAENLSLKEAAILAGIPKNPVKYNPVKHYKYALKRSNIVLKAMLKNKFITKKQYLENIKSKTKRFISKYFPFPFKAPLFCDFVKNQKKMDILKTTLSFDLQTTLSKILKNSYSDLNKKDIYNLSSIILNKNGEILAYKGSINYFDNEHAGQIDGLQTIRSVGSTLKPFLYAYAIEKGIILPSEMLEDIPTYYSGLTPENYNHKYSGLISVEYALYESLNLPAINLLVKIGINKFKEVLLSLGIDLKKQDKNSGLSLIIGNAYLKPFDVAQAYLTFINNGNFISITPFLNSYNLKIHSDYISKDSVYIISYYLRNSDENKVLFSYKTGTSNNYKDAWCIGFNNEYIVLVWCGNYNNLSSNYLMGKISAYPIVNKIFKILYKNKKLQPTIIPKNIIKEKVCSVSGLLPTSNCKNTVWDFFIKNKTPKKYCKFHKKIFVTVDNKYRLCNFCIKNKKYKKIDFLDFPPKINSFYRIIGKYNFYPHYPDCPKHKSELKSVKIIYPITKNTFYKTKKNIKIKFKLITKNDVKKLYWYINGVYYDKTDVIKERNILFDKIGKYKVTVMSDDASISFISFTIK